VDLVGSVIFLQSHQATKLISLPMRIQSGFKKQKKQTKRSGSLLKYIVLLSELANSQLKRTIPLPFKRPASFKSSKSYLQKDVLKKNFNNPYEKSTKKQLSRTFSKKFASIRYIVALILLPITLLSTLYLIFGKETFYLNAVTISGNKEIPEESLLQLANEHLSKRSLWGIKRSHRAFLHLTDLEDTFREKYGLDLIVFEPHWPSKSLSIIIEEKTPIIIYSVNDIYYTLDLQGNVIREIVDNEKVISANVPMIYQYDSAEAVIVGERILEQSSISQILAIYEGLQKFSDFSIHSFRLKTSNQKEVRVEANIPDQEPVNTEEEATTALEEAAQSIANAGSVQEQITQLKRALDDIDLERVEEENIQALLAQEQIYKVNSEYRLQELEVYMEQGWTLKVGHQILNGEVDADSIIDIFTTIHEKVDINAEVKEYIDLRFPERVYYR